MEGATDHNYLAILDCDGFNLVMVDLGGRWPRANGLRTGKRVRVTGTLITFKWDPPDYYDFKKKAMVPDTRTFDIGFGENVFVGLKDATWVILGDSHPPFDPEAG